MRALRARIYTSCWKCNRQRRSWMPKHLGTEHTERIWWHWVIELHGVPIKKSGPFANHERAVASVTTQYKKLWPRVVPK